MADESGSSSKSSSAYDSRYAKVQGVEREVKDQDAKPAETISDGIRLGDPEGRSQFCMSSQESSNAF